MSHDIKLQISSSLAIPGELATGSIALLATKGSGKTYTAAVLSEELVGHGVPVCSIDITGAHYGLKSSASGKSAGLPFTVFGGDHADVPLEEGSGEVLARWFVERRFCAILDLSHFSKEACFRFLTPFFSTVYKLNRQPIHLICDEADYYVPQKVSGDRAKCVGAVEDLVRRGRFKGIGSTLITQRPASINKDVLTQCDCLMAMRIGHPRDIDPVMEWVNVQADADAALEMVKSLPSLPTGHAWIWAPRLGIFQRITIRKRKTFDSSRTPEIGEQKVEPTAFASVDLDALGAEIKATADRAKENDPRTLKAKIAKLEADLSRRDLQKILEPVEVQLIDPEFVKRADALVSETNALHAKSQKIVDAAVQLQKDVAAALARIKAPALKWQEKTPTPGKLPVKPIRVKIGEARDLFETVPPAERKILIVLAQMTEGCGRDKLALLSGYRYSGGFRNLLGSLRTKGYMQGGNEEMMRITEGGLAALGDYEPLPTGSALGDWWLNSPRLQPVDKKVLNTLLLNARGYADGKILAEACGYSFSGGFRNILGRLRTAGVIVGKNTETITAHPDLFD